MAAGKLLLPLLLLVWLGAAPLCCSAAGVAAEGPPVLSPLIGPAQEREAILARGHQVTQPPLHHIRHQNHHFGDPRLRGYQHQAPLPGSPAPGLHAVHAPGPCVLSPEHLAAAAQATVTKVLEGVCNDKELRDRFHNLEAQLADQFNVLKTMILNLEDKIGAMDIGLERSERRLLSSISRSKCSRGRSLAEQEAESEPSSPQDYPDAVSAEEDEEEEDYDDLGGGRGRGSVLITTHKDGAQGPGVREEEMHRLNNTVHTELAPPGGNLSNTAAGCGHGRRVFTYYWRVRNMNYKLTGWNHRRSLRSPSFYVFPGGYRMYLRIYPRHSGENVYVHVGLTRGEYDGALHWPFRLKHRLAVLDQVSAGDPPAQDLVSRLWDPSQLCSGYNWQRPSWSPTSQHSGDNYECVGLGFPQAVLRSRSYIRQDAVVLKLTVCLDQQ